MHSVDDIALNMSLCKTRFEIENLNKGDIFDGIVQIELACCFLRCTCSLYPSIAIHSTIP